MSPKPLSGGSGGPRPEVVAGNEDLRERGSRYVFDNSWEDARRRLCLLEEAFDPGTVRRLRALGVGPGWSCLEVGGGGGSITRWLCSQVGRSGRVLAIDLDTRFLEEIEADNLDVRRLDLAAATLPRDEFDLVHARAVLMFVPGRDAIVESLARSLRPGGWLLLEEGDDYPVASGCSAGFAAAWRVVFDALAATDSGPALQWARRLPILLEVQNLCGVEAEAEVRMFHGGSPLAEFMSITWVQALEQIRLPEPEGTAVEHALKELEDPDRWFTMPALVAAWGRRAGTWSEGDSVPAPPGRRGHGRGDGDVVAVRWVRTTEPRGDPVLRSLRSRGHPVLVAARPRRGAR